MAEGTHKSHLYSDDHEGYSYKAGQYRYSEFVTSYNKKSLTIEQNYDTDYTPQFDNFKLELIGMDTLNISVEVSIDGGEFKSMDTSNLTISEAFRKVEIKF